MPGAQLGRDDHRPGWSCRGRAGRTAGCGRAACRGRIAPCSSSSSCSRTRCWAMNSASRRGRTLASASRSAVVGVRRRPRSSRHRARSSGPAQQPDRLLEQHRHAAAARRRRSRRPTGHRLVGLPGASSRARPGPGGPAPARPPATDGDAAPSPAPPTGPIRSRSSRTSRSAPFLPMPGTRVSVAVSPVAIARRTASGCAPPAPPGPAAGPTPLAVCSSSNSCLRVVVGEAVQGQRVLPHDQAGGQPGLGAGAQPGERARGALHRQADAADLDHGAVRRRPRPPGRARWRSSSLPPPAARCGRRARPAGPGCRRARRGRWPARARRRRRPAGAARPAAAAG